MKTFILKFSRALIFTVELQCENFHPIIDNEYLGLLELVLTTKAPLITVAEETRDKYFTGKTEVEVCLQCVCRYNHNCFTEAYHNE